MVKNKDMPFFVENLKVKTKKDKKFYLPEQGFEPQIFSKFPAHDLNFHVKCATVCDFTVNMNANFQTTFLKGICLKVC